MNAEPGSSPNSVVLERRSYLAQIVMADSASAMSILLAHSRLSELSPVAWHGDLLWRTAGAPTWR